MTNQTADYDNPWKEALSLYFRPFMAFFFPQIESEIDWSRGYEFLDKELQQIVREAEIGRKQADKLVKVWCLDGPEIWVLIHVEVQSQAQSNFPQRMYIYNYRLFDRYRCPVVSLAILADEQASWRPHNYRTQLWGCRVELEFPSVKLLDYQNHPEQIEESSNPFAIIVAAHLATQQTHQDSQGRYRQKLRIVKSLYQRGYSRQDILELFRLIDWMMALPDTMEKEFQQEIRNFEEGNTMRYVTNFERITRADERLLNSRETVIEALEVRFQEVPTDIVESISSLEDPNQLKTLHRQAITIGSISEFRQILEQLKLTRNAPG